VMWWDAPLSNSHGERFGGLVTARLACGCHKVGL
jgi:hypothetical protein